MLPGEFPLNGGVRNLFPVPATAQLQCVADSPDNGADQNGDPGGEVDPGALPVKLTRKSRIRASQMGTSSSRPLLPAVNRMTSMVSGMNATAKVVI